MVVVEGALVAVGRGGSHDLATGEGARRECLQTLDTLLLCGSR